MRVRLITVAGILLFGLALSDAFAVYPPVLEGTTERVYKSVDGVDLKIWVFKPLAETSKSTPSAIVFFFGGGWVKGTPMQFVPQCQYLARRGMCGILADYRVKSRNDVQAKYCVEDAHDAMRYVYEHADDLGIDPQRIGAGGGSAGGHLAACLGTLYSTEAYAPQLLALYNPATVLAPVTLPKAGSEAIDPSVVSINERLAAMRKSLTWRFGAPPELFSPWHHVSDKTPPTIIFHGTEDQTVPFETARMFEQKLKALGIPVSLQAYEGEKHSFYHKPDILEKTTAQLDAFLVSQGWLLPKQ